MRDAHVSFNYYSIVLCYQSKVKSTLCNSHQFSVPLKTVHLQNTNTYVQSVSHVQTESKILIFIKLDIFGYHSKRKIL